MRYILYRTCTGRMFIFSASSVTWVATPELYNTKLRATGHSVCSMMARVGGVFTPYLVLSRLDNLTIGIVLCIVNICAALASLSLPETKSIGLDSDNKVNEYDRNVGDRDIAVNKDAVVNNGNTCDENSSLLEDTNFKIVSTKQF